MSSDDTMQCTLFDEQGKCTAVVAVKKTMASLSLVGCIFMILVIWTFSKYKFFVQRLILYLTVAALLASTGHLLAGVKPEGPLCTFEAFWISFTIWAVLLWVLVITINLFLNAVFLISTEKFEILYSAFVWGVSLLVSCLPFIGDQYGPAGAWCWIKTGADVWRFAVWYIPLFTLIGVMVILYLIIVYQVNHRGALWQGAYNPDQERQRAMLKEYVRPLKVYPLIYLLTSVFPLINRLQNAFSKTHEPIFALTLLHAVTSPLQGLLNALVYGLDPETRNSLTWLQIKVALMKKKSRATIISEYKVDESAFEEKQEVDPSEKTDQSRVVEEGEPAMLSIDVDVHQSEPQVSFISVGKDSNVSRC